MNADQLAEYIGFLPNEDTMTALQTYAALVEKWNPKINLVAKSTIGDLWQRHIADSVQLHRHVPRDAKLCVDLGSGGGFPGVLLAILSRQVMPECKQIMVESDQRKSAFLREAIRATGVNAEVKSLRIEAIEALGADVLTARALASLSDLLGYAAFHMKQSGIAILPKGAAFASEYEAASKLWDFSVDFLPSLTDTEARILRITELRSKS